jgi:hypothetical protein
LLVWNLLAAYSEAVRWWSGGWRACTQRAYWNANVVVTAVRVLKYLMVFMDKREACLSRLVIEGRMRVMFLKSLGFVTSAWLWPPVGLQGLQVMMPMQIVKISAYAIR